MNFPLPSPVSPSTLIWGWGWGWHQINYSVKFVLFTLSGLKVKVGEFSVKFVKVCEWFDGCEVIDLKLYLNQGKTRLRNCPLFWK